LQAIANEFGIIEKGAGCYRSSRRLILSGTGIGDVSQEIGNLEQKRRYFVGIGAFLETLVVKKTVIRLENARLGRFKTARPQNACCSF
jgi:hypothetical protein